MLLVYGFLCLTLPLKTILRIEIAECTILHWTITFSKRQVTLSHAPCATEWNEDSRKHLCFRWVFSADLHLSLDYTVALACKAHSESFIFPFKELRKGVKSARALFCFPWLCWSRLHNFEESGHIREKSTGFWNDNIEDVKVACSRCSVREDGAKRCEKKNPRGDALWLRAAFNYLSA